MNEIKPNQGTQEAIDAGCQCPIMDNSYGKGYLMQEGVFVYNMECPIHGREKIISGDKV
jgi:hypothetical protein